jgi:hypothetical protein
MMRSVSLLAGMGRKKRREGFWWGNLERNKLRNISYYEMIMHVSGIGLFSGLRNYSWLVACNGS